MQASAASFNPCKSKRIASLAGASLLLFTVAHRGDARTGFGSRLLHPVPLAVPQGVTAVKVVMAQQANLSAAFAITGKAQRTEYVYDTLVSTAQESQASVLQAVNQMGLIGTSFYIANVVLVQAPPGRTISTTQLQQLQARSDVNSIGSVSSFNARVPAASAPALAALPPGRGLEKNISFINAPAVWAQGGQGQGITIGIVDSGFQWDHALLKTRYRGFSGSGVDHNYNWWDAVHATMTSGTNPCGVNVSAPCDDIGHGTHVTGVAVGGNGNDYQIGVAPGAQFMGCRDMDRGYASTGTTFEECMQFMLAPWDLNHQNPDPAKAPDIIVHPYHCYVQGASCIDDPVMHMVYWNLYAAGITTIVGAGDSGPLCSSKVNSPDVFSMAIVASALDYEPGTGLPSMSLASFSSAGPGTNAMIFKTDIAAPGTQILSAAPGGNVATVSSTSVAGPHLAGALALILSARPVLRGRPEQMWRLIGVTPPNVVDIGTCGSYSGNPNYVYGWGNLNASAMLAMANTD